MRHLSASQKNAAPAVISLKQQKTSLGAIPEAGLFWGLITNAKYHKRSVDRALLTFSSQFDRIISSSQMPKAYIYACIHDKMVTQWLQSTAKPFTFW